MARRTRLKQADDEAARQSGIDTSDEGDSPPEKATELDTTPSNFAARVPKWKHTLINVYCAASGYSLQEVVNQMVDQFIKRIYQSRIGDILLNLIKLSADKIALLAGDGFVNLPDQRGLPNSRIAGNHHDSVMACSHLIKIS